MIAYCSQQHQKQHWPQHKHLCKAIRDVLKDHKMKIRNVTSKEEWIKARMNFMLMVILKLTRRLDMYEEEMFKFPRVCLICHEENSQLLQDCHNCRAVSFCTKHKNSSIHKDMCYLLKLCLNLDILAMNVKRESLNFNCLQCVFDKKINDFRHMSDYIDTCINTWSCTLEKSDVLAADQSEHLTRPLTLLYGMQMLDYVPKYKSLVIHVIAASSVELATLEAWEVLLHLVPATVVSVKIIMIGPTVLEGIFALSDICSNCVLQEKKLLFECHSTLYVDYLNSPAFAKPDLVVGFNAGIHEHEIASFQETWAPSIGALAKQNYPLILSCYTQSEVELEIARINEILGTKTDCIYRGKNPFASLRPHRDWTENLFYHNNYIIIYRNLCP
nr:PREDICTED: putative protein MSS51 homolog, mitochondrial [Linepithema humile]